MHTTSDKDLIISSPTLLHHHIILFLMISSRGGEHSHIGHHICQEGFHMLLDVSVSFISVHWPKATDMGYVVNILTNTVFFLEHLLGEPI